MHDNKRGVSHRDGASCSEGVCPTFRRHRGSRSSTIAPAVSAYRDRGRSRVIRERRCVKSGWEEGARGRWGRRDERQHLPCTSQTPICRFSCETLRDVPGRRTLEGFGGARGESYYPGGGGVGGRKKKEERGWTNPVKVLVLHTGMVDESEEPTAAGGFMPEDGGRGRGVGEK